MKTTRMEIAEFQTAFERPLNQVLLECPSVSDRLLLGNLLLEEALETIEKGLGLTLVVDGAPLRQIHERLTLEHTEADFYDPIETADGLGDVNVVIHFIAHWLGMNLDKVTSEIHRSNMSKLGADGTPIINASHCICKRPVPHAGGCETHDPTKPVGKILKGPNFTTPNLQPILAAGNWIDKPITGHVSPTEIRPEAALDHCADHPDQNTSNCEGGYGLAGGGVGMYFICNTCGSVFGKTDDGEDF